MIAPHLEEFAEADSVIISAWEAGTRLIDICDRTGLSYHTVMNRVRALGLRDRDCRTGLFPVPLYDAPVASEATGTRLLDPLPRELQAH